MSTIDPTYADLGLALRQPAARQSLGQDDFLRLMTTQLQNQDPFKPMENGEFLGQIAQFSTVSGIQELQASFASLATSLAANQTLQAASLVGRGVLVSSETGWLPQGGELRGAAVLPASGDVVIDIVDASGTVVRTLDLGPQATGVARFAWDGRDNAGAAAAEGRYTMRARLLQGAAQTALETLAVGQVQSVGLGRNGLTLELVGLDPAPLADIVQIL
ncbi:flagellar hook assembly protein FlgD [Sinimarinibacterium thermocellulolyticum]|uniref:Basal-body rod modification protein FlgD n=1 Tax=Sinimarinibacterium thermocellulolyticum TaxID=3170016 RepID=A0ABV2AA60_9GAMM